MSLLGRTYFKLYTKYKDGLSTSYFRDHVRPKITDTKPVLIHTNFSAEIHVLTSSNDILNLFWTLKSFYHYSKREYALCIHDDGSLNQEHYRLLEVHFPSARIISKQVADAEMIKVLAAYPECLKFRQTNHLAPKVFDFLYYLQSDRMLLLDSDILFFKEPTWLLDCIESSDYKLNTVNADVKTSYTVSQAEVKAKLNIDLLDRFNSGLGLIHKSSLNLEWIEEFLKLPGIIGHFWRIEQTLFALCSARYGNELLPEDYGVFVTGKKMEIQSRHYVGEIRHLMYKEGMRRLVRNGFLKAIS